MLFYNIDCSLYNIGGSALKQSPAFLNIKSAIIENAASPQGHGVGSLTKEELFLQQCVQSRPAIYRPASNTLVKKKLVGYKST